MPANNKKIVTVRGDGSNWYWIYTVGPRGHAMSVQTFDRKGNAVNAARKVAETFKAELLVVGEDAGPAQKAPAKAEKPDTDKKVAKKAPAKKKAAKTPPKARKVAKKA